jgi:hypothetical protein
MIPAHYLQLYATSAGRRIDATLEEGRIAMRNAPRLYRARGFLLVFWLFIGVFVSAQGVRLDYGRIDGAIHYHLQSEVDCPVYIRLFPGNLSKNQ